VVRTKAKTGPEDAFPSTVGGKTPFWQGKRNLKDNRVGVGASFLGDSGRWTIDN
jgi:hypothetical protein